MTQHSRVTKLFGHDPSPKTFQDRIVECTNIAAAAQDGYDNAVAAMQIEDCAAELVALNEVAEGFLAERDKANETIKTLKMLDSMNTGVQDFVDDLFGGRP